jgi:hypothetical protein
MDLWYEFGLGNVLMKKARGNIFLVTVALNLLIHCTVHCAKDRHFLGIFILWILNLENQRSVEGLFSQI